MCGGGRDILIALSILFGVNYFVTLLGVSVCREL